MRLTIKKLVGLGLVAGMMSGVSSQEGHPIKGSWIGENLAVGNVTARTVMAMWKASPPHRANLLNGHFAAVGIGAAPGTYLYRRSRL